MHLDETLFFPMARMPRRLSGPKKILQCHIATNNKQIGVIYSV